MSDMWKVFLSMYAAYYISEKSLTDESLECFQFPKIILLFLCTEQISVTAILVQTDNRKWKTQKFSFKANVVLCACAVTVVYYSWLTCMIKLLDASPDKDYWFERERVKDHVFHKREKPYNTYLRQTKFLELYTYAFSMFLMPASMPLRCVRELQLFLILKRAFHKIYYCIFYNKRKLLSVDWFN